MVIKYGGAAHVRIVDGRRPHAVVLALLAGEVSAQRSSCEHSDDHAQNRLHLQRPRHVQVRLLGGELVIDARRDSMTMRGPAKCMRPFALDVSHLFEVGGCRPTIAAEEEARSWSGS